MKILNTIGPQFNKEAKNILESAANVDYLNLTQAELRGKIGGYDAAVIGLGLRFDKEIIDNAPNLKFIATATTGTDHIDTIYAKENGISILNLLGEDLKEVTGTAELAFGLLLSLVRHIPESFDDVKKGNWDRTKFLGHNLYGKTLGILGLGRLGSMMAQYGKAFGMRVIAHDLRKDVSDVTQLVDSETFLAESDFISIHIPLNDGTAYTFKKDVFEKMKDSAYLINTSRGSIVDEVDLVEALENKKIAGYATDVLSLETVHDKVPQEHWQIINYSKNHNNLIITPHIGGFTAESRAATDIIIAQKVKECIQTL